MSQGRTCRAKLGSKLHFMHQHFFTSLQLAAGSPAVTDSNRKGHLLVPFPIGASNGNLNPAEQARLQAALYISTFFYFLAACGGFFDRYSLQ